MKNVLNSKEFEGMVHFVAFVYLARVVLNLVEGKGVENLLLIGVGLVAGMFIRNKMMLIAAAVAMVVFVKIGLVVKEGMGCGDHSDDKGKGDAKKDAAKAAAAEEQVIATN